MCSHDSFFKTNNRVRTAQGKPGKRDSFEKNQGKPGKLREFSDHFYTTSGKTKGILFCQISLPSSLGHLATNQTNVLLTGTLTNPVTAFSIPSSSL